MKVLLHASLDFVEYMVKASNFLKENGVDVILPELTRYQHIRDVEGDDVGFTRIKNRLTLENISNVENCDCILILNYTHRGYDNYIGGNSFLEMIVAFYLKKPIYLLNSIPEGMTYTEEIKSLYPTIVYNLDNFIKLIQNNDHDISMFRMD